MMTKLKCILLIPIMTLLAVVLLPQAFSQDQSHTSSQPVPPVKKNISHSAPPTDDGERVFKQNCARCHTPPDGFSTRISGTIVRHMRVRANLSQKDAEALMHYLNP
jgi:hypothetical protein